MKFFLQSILTNAKFVNFISNIHRPCCVIVNVSTIPEAHTYANCVRKSSPNRKCWIDIWRHIRIGFALWIQSSNWRRKFISWWRNQFSNAKNVALHFVDRIDYALIWPVYTIRTIHTDVLRAVKHFPQNCWWINMLLDYTHRNTNTFTNATYARRNTIRKRLWNVTSNYTPTQRNQLRVICVVKYSVVRID